MAAMSDERRLRDFARGMRKEATDAERRLWGCCATDVRRDAWLRANGFRILRCGTLMPSTTTTKDSVAPS